MSIHIERINHTSHHLKSVEQLYRAHAATLGMFPKGAFVEHAIRRQILVALDEDGACMGYLLYRTSSRFQRASITHLCVDTPFRRLGVAHALVDHLKQITQSYDGILATCRRDYDAHRIWPQLGFVARGEKLGRGKDGALLTTWWYSHGHPSLFTLAEDQLPDFKFKVVMDANVFYALTETETTAYQEAQALLADWLQDDVALCLTPEIMNEINRNNNPAERKKQRFLTNTFKILPSSDLTVQNLKRKLRSIFPLEMSPSDESDLAQLAYAISGGAHFFITRDTELLRNAETILAGYGLPVITPTDFIVHLDELRRAIEYQPARLAGSQIQIGRVRSGQEVVISSEFQSSQQETKRAFQQRLNLLFADPRHVQTEIVTDIDQQPLALISFDRRTPLQLTVPVFRLKHNPLSATLCRKLVLRAIDIAVEEKLSIIVISDTALADEVQQTLRDLGFFHTGQRWLRIVLQVVGRTNELIASIQQLSRLLVGETNALLALGHDLESVLSTSAPEQQIEIEQRLRPVKIVDIDVPTYIVPIRPYWAMHLFDEGIAQQDMFGAKPDLALSGENVYYRSSRPAVVSAPARILWYVSNDRRYPGAKHIRACSYLNEVICGKPKVLFKRFHRLGIYEWKQVLETARGDQNSEIMAMGFSGTELFKRPIAWHEVQRMLQEIEGRVSQIQSPVRVSQEYFLKIYQAGMNNVSAG